MVHAGRGDTGVDQADQGFNPVDGDGLRDHELLVQRRIGGTRLRTKAVPLSSEKSQSLISTDGTAWASGAADRANTAARRMERAEGCMGSMKSGSKSLSSTLNVSVLIGIKTARHLPG